MKHLFYLYFFLIGLIRVNSQTLPSIHSLPATTINDEEISLSKYAGKKVMIVNTASYCGYTSQFATLQLLYKNFNRFGFEIIGFPSNDFGAQDPYNDSTIQVFCTSNYGVTFQMMSKIHIKTGDTSMVYRWLQQANLNGLKNVTVSWNFNKFLINESGNFVKHYTELTEPNDTAIVKWIMTESSIKTGKSEIENSLFEIKLHSNIISNSDLILSLTKKIDKQLDYNIYSVNGITIPKKQGKLEVVEQNLTIDVASLENGIYFLEIKNADYSVFKKFIIQR